MNDLRTAAQQALEVLKFCTPKPRPTDDDYAEQGWKEHNAAITALRSALAQQDEPAQEPVAWRYKPMIGSSWSLSDDGYYISCKRDKGYIVDSLYTAPPRRTMVPLTEGEIVDAVRESDFDWQAGWTLDEHEPNRFTTLVRAVERASWEKHHGKA